MALYQRIVMADSYVFISECFTSKLVDMHYMKYRQNKKESIMSGHSDYFWLEVGRAGELAKTFPWLVQGFGVHGGGGLVSFQCNTCGSQGFAQLNSVARETPKCTYSAFPLFMAVLCLCRAHITMFQTLPLASQKYLASSRKILFFNIYYGIPSHAHGQKLTGMAV